MESRHKIALLIVAWLSFIPFIAQAQTSAPRSEVSGRVFIHDTSTRPGDFVMVYSQEYGTGTLTDEQGYYTLKLPAGSGKEVKLEYSRINFSSLTNKVKLTGGSQQLDDVTLEFQALMLAAAYVTPDGRDPADVILSQVWEQAKGNRKKPFDYWADINYDFATHDLPIAATFFSKFTVGVAKLFGVHEGYGPLVKYCLKNDDLSASVSLKRRVKDGKAIDMNHKLVRCDQDLPREVQKNVMSLFSMVDLFDMIYGDANVWGAKFSKKHKFKIVGTYEYNGRVVDVLKWTEGKKRMSATLHVVEDLWVILKVQVNTNEGEILRCEARDIGNGMYMPISFVMKPALSLVRAEDIPGYIEEARKNKDLSKATANRIIKVLEDHKGEDFNPYVSVGYNVRYKLDK